MYVVLEIGVLKRQRENEIATMRDSCAMMTYGGECGVSAYCKICLIADDVRELTRIFESKGEKMDFSKSSTNI